MAARYGAGQYEDAFTPYRLQSWSVPPHGRQRPLLREGSTTIIANDRGHLLPSVPRSQVSPWGTFVGTWDMPPRIPPAQLNLTSRSADAARRLTDWIHRPTTLTHACNGIRTHVTGKPQEPRPDVQTTKKPPQRSSRAPTEDGQRLEEPPGPGAGPMTPLSHQSSRMGVQLEGDVSLQPPAPHQPCSQQDKLGGQTPCSHQPAVTDPQHGNPRSPQIPASVPLGTSPQQTAPTRVPTASPGGKSPGLRASRA